MKTMTKFHTLQERVRNRIDQTTIEMKHHPSYSKFMRHFPKYNTPTIIHISRELQLFSDTKMIKRLL